MISRKKNVSEAGMRRSVIKRDKKIKGLAAELASVTKQKAKLWTIAEKKRTEISKLNSRIEKADDEFRQLREKCEKNANELYKLSKRCAKRQNKICKLTDLCEQKNAEVSTLIKTTKEQCSELTALRAKVSSTDQVSEVQVKSEESSE